MTMTTWSPIIAPCNHVPGMINQKNNTLTAFGKDVTGKILYRFNHEGFRGHDFSFVPQYAFFGISLVFGIGVNETEIFPYLFEQAHNYGLAGSYDNHDIMITLEKFLASSLYTPATQMAVVWHSRDSECLEEFYMKLHPHNIIHFYCGKVLPFERCFAMVPEVDQDVSKTHPGPKTHRLMYKMLCGLFDKP